MDETIASQAKRLLDNAIAQSMNVRLDDNSAQWLLTYAGYERFVREMSTQHLMRTSSTVDGEERLFNIPLRVTHGDKPATPEIQLVMEPLQYARR